MKLFCLFIAVGFLFAQSQAVPAVIQNAALFAIRSFCQIISQVDPSIVVEVRGGNFTTQDEKMKDYAFCVYKTLGLTTVDGDVDKEVGLQIIPPHTDPAKFVAAVDACSGEAGKTTVEKFWNGLVCYSKQYPGDIFAL